MIRRMRVQRGTQFASILIQANVPFEDDFYTLNTLCFEFPVYTGELEVAEDISLYRQAMNVALLQAEWADNAVSNTLNFKPKWRLISVEDDNLENSKAKFDPRFVKVVNEFGKRKIYHLNKDHEENDVEPVLSMIMPHVKSISLLPHSDKGCYPQMPEEGITKQEYERRVSEINEIDWSSFNSFDGVDEKYCDSDNCEINPAKVMII